MRLFLVIAATATIAAPLEAQGTLQLSFFEGRPSSAGNAGDVIARRQSLRAWQDSVQVYAEQAVAQQPGWRLAAPNGLANFRVSVIATQVAKPGVSGFAVGVTVFEPATLVPWRYLTHYVLYTESAQEAGAALIAETIAAIRWARQP